MIGRRTLLPLFLSFAACGGREQLEDDATTADAVEDEGARFDAATFDTTVDSMTTDSAEVGCRDVPDPIDYGHDVPPVPCAAPLSDDVTYGAAPSPAMCTEANGHGTFERWACSCRGYQAIWYGVGADCLALHLFDARTGAHVAKLTKCVGGWRCAEGPPSFFLPEPFCCKSDIEFLCGGAGPERCDAS